MNISIPDGKIEIIAHGYAVLVEHPKLNQPFKMVVSESIQKGTGKSLGWLAAPEIQLRQTISHKQEYLVSNANPTPEGAVLECLGKILMGDTNSIFYKSNFEEKYNKLW